MYEHLKKHRNVYSLLFLVLVSLMVAWLFLSVEKLDIQMSKITGNIFSTRSPQIEITTVGGSVAAPDGLSVNRENVTVSGQLNDLPDGDSSVDANIPGGDAPNDSDDVSADTSGTQIDASGRGRPDENDSEGEGE